MEGKVRDLLFSKVLGLYVYSWKTQFVIYGLIFSLALAIAVVLDFGIGLSPSQVIKLIVLVVFSLLFLVPICHAIVTTWISSRKEPRKHHPRSTYRVFHGIGYLRRRKHPFFSSSSESSRGVNEQMQIPNDNTSGQEEKDRRFREVLQPRLALIVSTIAIIVSTFTFINAGDHGFNLLLKYIRDNIKLIVILSNLAISLVAFFFLAKQKTVDFIIQDKEKFKSLAELDAGVDIQIYTANLKNRVDKLVNQFRLHMTLFTFSLILIYGVLFLAALKSGSEIIATSSPGSVSISESQIVPEKDFVIQKTFRTIDYFPITTNLINLLGALFVQLGFSVLYVKTLEVHKDQIETTKSEITKDQYRLETTQFLTYNSSLYWGIPLMLFVLYALIFISLSVSYSNDKNFVSVTHFLNIFDLLAGSANGLAMSLLFGRYASIERAVGETQRFKNVYKTFLYPFSSLPYKALVSFGIVFILPIYALAQPLFGSLKIDSFGNPDNFETVVFAICFIGKICFFHLTYILISKRLLHLYLYGVASKVGNYRELDKCFDQ